MSQRKPEYTQGIRQDGAAILKDGQPMTIEEILAELNAARAGGEVEAVGVLDEDGEGLYARIGADDLEHTGAKIGDPVYLRAPTPAAKVPDGWTAEIENFGRREKILIISPSGVRVSFSAVDRKLYANTEQLLCELADWITAAPQPVEGDKPDLLGFCYWLFTNVWPHGDADGGDLEDMGVKFGILKPEEVTQSCGEYCRCAEWDDFPQTCYRLSLPPTTTPETEA